MISAKIRNTDDNDAPFPRVLICFVKKHTARHETIKRDSLVWRTNFWVYSFRVNSSTSLMAVFSERIAWMDKRLGYTYQQVRVNYRIIQLYKNA